MPFSVEVWLTWASLRSYRSRFSSATRESARWSCFVALPRRRPHLGRAGREFRRWWSWNSRGKADWPVWRSRQSPPGTFPCTCPAETRPNSRNDWCWNCPCRFVLASRNCGPGRNRWMFHPPAGSAPVGWNLPALSLEERQNLPENKNSIKQSINQSIDRWRNTVITQSINQSNDQ